MEASLCVKESSRQGELNVIILLVEVSDCDMQCIKPIILPVQKKGFRETINMELPCGKCIGCRIKKKQEMALRLWHESGYHEHSSFLTLTYEDSKLPESGSLSLTDLQSFIKRIRKRLDQPLKYLAVGEYGDDTWRPHYHGIFFGIGLNPHHRKLVMDCWTNCDWSVASIRNKSFGLVEPQSIRYVAGYIEKKLDGEAGNVAYVENGINPVFRLLSKGIGRQYVLDNKNQIVDNGFVSWNGVKFTLPRYYLKVLEKEYGLTAEDINTYSKDNDMKIVEHITGLSMQSDDVIKTLNPELIDKYTRGKMQINKQSGINQQSRLNLKSRVLKTPWHAIAESNGMRTSAGSARQLITNETEDNL